MKFQRHKWIQKIWISYDQVRLHYKLSSFKKYETSMQIILKLKDLIYEQPQIISFEIWLTALIITFCKNIFHYVLLLLHLLLFKNSIEYYVLHISSFPFLFKWFFVRLKNVSKEYKLKTFVVFHFRNKVCVIWYIYIYLFIYTYVCHFKYFYCPSHVLVLFMPLNMLATVIKFIMLALQKEFYKLQNFSVFENILNISFLNFSTSVKWNTGFYSSEAKNFIFVL